jgi:signal peptidase II
MTALSAPPETPPGAPDAAAPDARRTAPPPRRPWRWLALAAGVILADQASKRAVLAQILPGEGLAVSANLNLVLAYNRGAAFSFLNGPGVWQGYLFLAIALAASVVIVRLLARPGNAPLFSLALGMILGGALGNAVDRLHFGYVVDFLDFHWDWLGMLFAGGHFPAFNLADSAITGGVMLLIVDEVLRQRRPS